MDQVAKIEKVEDIDVNVKEEKAAVVAEDTKASLEDGHQAGGTGKSDLMAVDEPPEVAVKSQTVTPDDDDLFGDGDT